jgi:hypothetical protein
MDREMLEEGYYRVLTTIYDPRVYFERCLAVLERYPRAEKAKQLQKRIEWREIVGLVNSVVRQLFSGYGIAYLRYMARALRRRPDLIVGIVTMAIQGHHYFTITKRVLRSRRKEARVARRLSTQVETRDSMTLVPEPSTAK